MSRPHPGVRPVAGLFLVVARAANGVIGGGEIYALFLPHAQRIELTEIHAEFPGDTTLAAFDPGEWRELRREPQVAGEGEPAYDFVTLERAA